MKPIAGVACLVGGQAAAGISCTLTDVDCVTKCEQTQVAFAIDASQFAAPQDPNDPPRRQITHVTLNAETFAAQAIRMDGGIVGFHYDVGQTETMLLIVQPDGTARLSRQPLGQILSGHCTRT